MRMYTYQGFTLSDKFGFQTDTPPPPRFHAIPNVQVQFAMANQRARIAHLYDNGPREWLTREPQHAAERELRKMCRDRPQ